MTRRLISSGSVFEEKMAYSRAVVAGDWVFVAGTTGFDYGTMSISDSLLEQTEQCFKNIESALREAGATMQDVVRVTYVLTDGSAFEQCWPVLRKYFATVRPAAMMITAGLADSRMKIEMEVTALKVRPEVVDLQGDVARPADCSEPRVDDGWSSRRTNHCPGAGR